MEIRLMTGSEEEIRRVNEIYTAAVLSKFMTAERTPLSLEERLTWYHSMDPDEYPVFLAIQNNEILGWLAIKPYREGREALKHTKELSYYLDHAHLGKGIGTALMQWAISYSRDQGTRILLAIVLENNSASIRLLEKFKFGQWGFLPQVADFDGEICGHYYYGLQIS